MAAPNAPVSVAPSSTAEKPPPRRMLYAGLPQESQSSAGAGSGAFGLFGPCAFGVDWRRWTGQALLSDGRWGLGGQSAQELRYSIDVRCVSWNRDRKRRETVPCCKIRPIRTCACVITASGSPAEPGTLIAEILSLCKRFVLQCLKASRSRD